MKTTAVIGLLAVAALGALLVWDAVVTPGTQFVQSSIGGFLFGFGVTWAFLTALEPK
jgi:hypothetical protein